MQIHSRISYTRAGTDNGRMVIRDGTEQLAREQLHVDHVSKEPLHFYLVLREENRASLSNSLYHWLARFAPLAAEAET